jgi:hypothetical protein
MDESDLGQYLENVNFDFVGLPWGGRLRCVPQTFGSTFIWEVWVHVCVF